MTRPRWRPRTPLRRRRHRSSSRPACCLSVRMPQTTSTPRGRRRPAPLRQSTPPRPLRWRRPRCRRWRAPRRRHRRRTAALRRRQLQLRPTTRRRRLRRIRRSKRRSSTRRGSRAPPATTTPWPVSGRRASPTLSTSWNSVGRPLPTASSGGRRRGSSTASPECGTSACGPRRMAAHPTWRRSRLTRPPSHPSWASAPRCAGRAPRPRATEPTTSTPSTWIGGGRTAIIG
mmetsp:Transcript_98241/g.283486  ORF Transcript_98241/g.283486 Transcript_98241/m.283486 type:complete len:230 (+) Transcript_98241:95-784(+)